MKGDSLVVVEHNTLNFARTPSFAHPNLAAPVTHPFSALSSARAPRCACLPASVNVKHHVVGDPEVAKCCVALRAARVANG